MYTRYTDRSQGQVLTMDRMRTIAPSIFATDKHTDTSTRYQYIPTIKIVEAMMSEGFQPVRCAQSKARREDRQEHTKHMVVFRAPNTQIVNVGDTAPEIVLVNAHDGTSSYQLHAALFRKVCSNGLIVSDGTLAAVRVPHFGKNVAGDVIEGTYSIVQALPEVAGQVEDWRATAITQEIQLAYARAALELRYDTEDQQPPITPAQLVQPRRTADQAGDVWTTFNVVQENIMQGGLHGQRPNGKQTTTRAIRAVNETVRMNKALWTLTQELAKVLK